MRLAILDSLLQNWRADVAHIEAALKVATPLVAAARKLLLTKAESAELHQLAGQMSDIVVELMQNHYSIYPDEDKVRFSTGVSTQKSEV